jgi:hypothetical protein
LYEDLPVKHKIVLGFGSSSLFTSRGPFLYPSVDLSWPCLTGFPGDADLYSMRFVSGGRIDLIVTAIDAPGIHL